jgi:hypothetical protein
MTAARHLTVIDTSTGEVIEAQDPLDEVKALRASLARQEKIITALRNDKARERKNYLRRGIVEEMFEAWQHATGKTRSRLTDDRFDAIRGLLEMKEPYTPEQWKLMLAGLEHYPYVVYGARRSHGSEEIQARRHRVRVRQGRPVRGAREPRGSSHEGGGMNAVVKEFMP